MARAKTAEAQKQVHGRGQVGSTSSTPRARSGASRTRSAARRPSCADRPQLAASSLDAQFNELDDLGELTEVDARLAALKAGGSQGAISG